MDGSDWHLPLKAGISKDVLQRREEPWQLQNRKQEKEKKFRLFMNEKMKIGEREREREMD